LYVFRLYCIKFEDEFETWVAKCVEMSQNPFEGTQEMSIIDSCIWILLRTKIIFAYMYVCQYVYVCACVYVCVCVCVYEREKERENIYTRSFILSVVKLKWVWRHSQSKSNFFFFSCVTMVIGCDVSHKTSPVLSMVTSIVTMETQFWSHWQLCSSIVTSPLTTGMLCDWIIDSKQNICDWSSRNNWNIRNMNQGPTKLTRSFKYWCLLQCFRHIINCVTVLCFSLCCVSCLSL